MVTTTYSKLGEPTVTYPVDFHVDELESKNFSVSAQVKLESTEFIWSNPAAGLLSPTIREVRYWAIRMQSFFIQIHWFFSN